MRRLYFSPFRKILYAFFGIGFTQLAITAMQLIAFGMIPILLALFIGFSLLDLGLEKRGFYEEPPPQPECLICDSLYQIKYNP